MQNFLGVNVKTGPLDVEADAELEAQLPAWIRRESADRDAADADGKRPVSAG